MTEDRFKEIKESHRQMVEASIVLWNARLDALGGDPKSLDNLLRGTLSRGMGGSDDGSNDNCDGAECNSAPECKGAITTQ